MIELTYKKHKIHYEIYGKGEPLLILNGIMMSTNSWHQFIPELSKHNQLILLDFVDQGQSDSYNNKEQYDYTFQTGVVKALLDNLKIAKINIAAISYGGEIALDFSSKYPSYVNRQVIFNTTAYTSKWMEEIFKMWNEAGSLRNGSIYYKATIPVIYSPTFYTNNLEWMKEREQLLVPLFSEDKFQDRMNRLTLSTMKYDVRNQLKDIVALTLIVASEEDFLTPIVMQHELNSGIKGSSMVIIPKVGHASMYEDPAIFVSLIVGFINR